MSIGDGDDRSVSRVEERANSTAFVTGLRDRGDVAELGEAGPLHDQGHSGSGASSRRHLAGWIGRRHAAIVAAARTWPWRRETPCVSVGPYARASPLDRVGAKS